MQYLIIAAIIMTIFFSFSLRKYRRLNKQLLGTLEKLQFHHDTLLETESRFEQLALQSKIFISEVDTNGTYTYVGKSVQAVLGYLPEELVEKKQVWDLHPEAGREAFKVECLKIIESKDKLIGFEHSMVSKDGTIVYCLSDDMPLLSETGELLGYRGYNTDISYSNQVERALRESEEKFRTLFENMQEGVALHDIIYDDYKNAVDYTITDVNPAFEKLTGIVSSETTDIKTSILSNMEKASFLEKYAEVARTAVPYVFETYIDKLEKHFKISAFSPKMGQFATVLEDITERKNTEEQIKYLSFHDSLTDLYNRRFLEEELKRLDTERNIPISLIMADVNGLKLANDAFGHLVGDEILQTAANLIKAECRSDDIIARIGGDEFVILLPKTDFEAAEYLINRIKKAISTTKVGSINLSISFGAATKTETSESIEKIFKQAEDYMYQQKLYESPRISGNTLKTIIDTLHDKLPGEQQHANNVSKTSEKIAIGLGFSKNDLNDLRTVGHLHDIGKITINETIFLKQGKLDYAEWLEVRRHSENGYHIIKSVNKMVHIAEYILAHHENWDGSGYPKGLKGEEIPLHSRIIRIADSYDAMLSTRNYKTSISKDEAIEEIKKNAGIQFDPDIVKVFIEVATDLDD